MSDSELEEELWGAIPDIDARPDNCKAATKETGGNRNGVSTENVANLIDCKEIKQKSVTRS